MKTTILKITLALALTFTGALSVQGLIPDDADGDGVPDSVDVCPAEDASGFDRDGDGCVDEFIGARHIEYWSTGSETITYVINSTAAPNISDGSDITAVRAAIDAWPNVAGTDINVVYGGTTSQSVADGLDGVNLVTFLDNTYPFSSLVLAVGLSTSFETDTLIAGRVWRKGEIFDADMIFNPSKTYRTSGTVGVDIQSVATHEAGHLLGIAHSAIASATMFPVLPGGNAARSLEMDDELVVLKAYGVPAALQASNRIEGTVVEGGTLDAVGGAIVYLVTVAGDTAACDFTLADGRFTFPGLPDGDYYVSIHPLDGSSPIGYIEPGNINALVVEIAVTDFAPEYFDAGESDADDPSARVPVQVSGGSVATVAIVTNTDSTGPVVLKNTPADGTAGTPVDGAYIVEFSEPIDVGTVVASFSLRDNVTNQAKGGVISLVRDDSVLVFLPSPRLDFSRAYTLTIDTDLRDRVGNPIAAAFSFQFSTEPEPPLSISSLSPAKGVVGNTVVVNGQGFSEAPLPAVRFGGVDAVVVSGNTSRLVVKVPASATTGPVTVTNPDLSTSNTLTFTVLSSAEFVRGFDSGELTFGAPPSAVVVTPDGDYVYAATGGGAEAVVANPGLAGYLTGTTIPYPQPLTGLAVNPGGTRVYALCAATGELVEIMSDPSTGPVFNTVLSSRPLGAMPKGIVIDPTGDRAYVATDEAEIQVWDIRLGSPTYQQPVSSLAAPGGASLQGAMDITPAGDRLLAATETGDVLIFDLTEPPAVFSIAGGGGPGGGGDEGGSGGGGSGRGPGRRPMDPLAAGDPPVVVPVGAAPRDLAIDPAGERAYVSHEDGDISVLNIEGVAFEVQDIATGGSLRGLSVTPGGGYLYAVDRVLDNVKIIDLEETNPTFRSVIEDIEAAGNPVDVVISPDGLYAFTVRQGTTTPPIAPSLLVTTIGIGPEIHSLHPLAGVPGTKVIISGNELGDPLLDQVSVDFNGVAVPAELVDHVEIVATVPVGATSGPVRVVVRRGGETIDRLSNAVAFEVIPQFSAGRLRLAAGIPGAGNQGEMAPVIAMRPQGDLILVGNDGGASVQAIDIRPGSPTFHQEILRMKPFGAGVTDIAITADGKTAFMCNDDDGDTRLVPAINCDPRSPGFGDQRTTAGNGFLFSTAAMVRTSPENRWLAVWDLSASAVLVFDALGVSDGVPPTLAAVIPADGAFVFDMAFHPSGRSLYIARNSPNAILVVDMNENGIEFGLVQAIYEIPGPPGMPTESPMSLQVARAGDAIDVLTYETSGGPVTRSLYRYPVSLNGMAFGTPVQYAFPSGAHFMFTERIRTSPRGDYGLHNGSGIGIRQYTASDPSNQVAVTGLFESLSQSEFEFTPDGSRVYFASTYHDSVRVYDFYGGTSDLYYLAIASGGGQNGTVNRELPAPIRAVTYGEGLSLPGLVMTFRVVSGDGGFVTAEGVVPELNVATDSDGFAEVRWMLGPTTGRQEIQVIAEGIDQSPRTVFATAGEDPESLPLSIAEVLPLDNTSNVSATTAVLATFSRALDPASITGGSLYIEALPEATKVPVTFGFTDGNRKASLTPGVPLAYSKQYRVVYAPEIEDATGGALSNPGSSAFFTQAPPPPTLSSVSPPASLPGVTLVLSGAGFDPVPANNVVLFGAIEAAAVSGTTSRLEVVVPANAATGTISVRAGSTTSNTLRFTVLQPNTSPIDEVIATVGTGTGVKSCAITPDGALCYTVSPDGDVVVPVDIETQSAFPSIAVGDQPVAIVIHPDGGSAYIANFNSGNVSVIDTDPASPNFNKVTATIAVGTNPIDLAVLPDGDRVLVANAGSGDVSVVDGEDGSMTFNQVIATVGAATNTKSVAISPDGTLIYLGTDNGFVVMAASGYAVIATVGTGTGTKSLAISPDGTLLFIVATDGSILIVDIIPDSPSENQVVATVGVGTNTKSVAISPDGTLLYVIPEVGDEVLVIAINVIPGVSAQDPDAAAPAFRVETELLTSIPVGSDPAFVAVDPSGSGAVIVANEGDRTISILDQNLPPLEARFEVIPPLLIVKIKNPFVRGMVQLPDGFSVRDIDLASVRFNGTVPADPGHVAYVDLTCDHVEEVLYAFRKTDVVATLDPSKLLQKVEITGTVQGRAFRGEDWLLALFPRIGHHGSDGFLSNTIVPGEPALIRWDSPEGYNITSADVSISLDNGATWQPIATQIPDTGEFTWLPPRDALFRYGLVMVTLYSGEEMVIDGVSAQPFAPFRPEPTALRAARVEIEDGAAILRWETLLEAGTEGFHVLRAETEEGPFRAITVEAIRANGGAEGGQYEFADRSLRPNRVYYYKVATVETDGSGQEFGPYQATYRLAFGLEQNVPNPFNPTTTIRYSIAEDVNVSLVVYDVAGRQVRTLVNQRQRADAYRIAWDGLNDQGQRVASGMYFYRLVAGRFTETKKMMLLK